MVDFACDTEPSEILTRTKSYLQKGIKHKPIQIQRKPVKQTL